MNCFKWLVAGVEVALFILGLVGFLVTKNLDCLTATGFGMAGALFVYSFFML